MSNTLIEIGGVKIIQDDSLMVHWISDMDIDADGCPQAYHPIDKLGLDAHSSAGYPNGGWRSVLAAKTKISPAYVQGRDEAAPGYFVSMTSYKHKGFKDTQTERYVNAYTVPYIVVPPQVRSKAKGIVLGCLGEIEYNGTIINAVVADIGPKNKTGEASIAAARMLGIKSSPRDGGVDARVVKYRIYPNIPALINGFTYELIPLGN